MIKNINLRIIWLLAFLLVVGIVSFFLQDSPFIQQPTGHGFNKGRIVHMEVIKSQRVLRVYQRNEQGTLTLAKVYKIALGPNSIGHKQEEGDRRTPEGEYKIIRKHKNSSYHRSLEISYPRIEDRIAAQKKGVLPGGKIMIHGLRNGFGWIGKHHTTKDWTLGCVAVTNEEIEEIFARTDIGTPIVILP